MSDSDKPELRIVDPAVAHEPTAPAAPQMTQALIDAVSQLEASRRDTSAKGFQKRLQLAYAVYDQAVLMVAEIEGQHAKLVADMLAVERRSALPAG